jgi:hypothetical protein
MNRAFFSNDDHIAESAGLCFTVDPCSDRVSHLPCVRGLGCIRLGDCDFSRWRLAGDSQMKLICCKLILNGKVLLDHWAFLLVKRFEPLNIMCWRFLEN